VKKKVIYLIGSLRNQEIRDIGIRLREQGFEVFNDWISAGPEADEFWQKHERMMGHTYKEALNGWHAENVFEFDYKHLNRADIAVLALPAGKSGFLELGYFTGTGKPGFILLDKEPERFDIMPRFCIKSGGAVCDSEQELIWELQKHL